MANICLSVTTAVGTSWLPLPHETLLLIFTQISGLRVVQVLSFCSSTDIRALPFFPLRSHPILLVRHHGSSHRQHGTKTRVGTTSSQQASYSLSHGCIDKSAYTSSTALDTEPTSASSAMASFVSAYLPLRPGTSDSISSFGSYHSESMPSPSIRSLRARYQQRTVHSTRRLQSWCCTSVPKEVSPLDSLNMLRRIRTVQSEFCLMVRTEA